MTEDKQFKLVAKTVAGLENVLAAEIESIGGKNLKLLKRGVEFYGDQKVMYKANYLLRTAINVLKPIKSFKASTPEELYNGVRDVEWMKIFDIGNTISVNASSYNSEMNHTRYISQKTKDAVVDYFNYKFGRRPDVDTVEADVQLYVHLNNDNCELSLNSSGNPLFKRGYRQKVGVAPLNEVLAAGMILLSGWDKKSNFIDPMCGSGTLAIEAAMIAMNLPAGFYRYNYSFMHWSDFDRMLWKEVKQEALNDQYDYEGEIFASDISPKSIEIVKTNLEYTRLHKDITVKQIDMANLKPPDGGGVVMINPPYGERIRTKDISGLYKTIGDSLKFNFTGYDAWVISSDLEALKLIGLRPAKRYDLMNGALKCKFNGYSIYKGSKKDQFENRNTK
jgi:putative N6-adenine-specific DNA methylase